MERIPKATRDKIAAAAHYRCGYCQTAQEISGAQMHTEHIIPISRGGGPEESNLCLSCAWCNSFKSAKTHGTDSQTNEEIPLYNPRTQQWHEHFRWSEDGIYIIGLTPTGRATVEALKMNNEYIIPARRHWVEAGWHPPGD